jgi:hypothetical protein
VEELVKDLRCGASTSTDVNVHLRKYQALCGRAADALAAQQQELSKWRQPYVKCFTCGAPASKVIHLPEGCAAQPDVQGIVGICPQHESTIEPSEQYHVLCDLTATTPDALAARDAEIGKLREAGRLFARAYKVACDDFKYQTGRDYGDISLLIHEDAKIKNLDEAAQHSERTRTMTDRMGLKQLIEHTAQQAEKKGHGFYTAELYTAIAEIERLEAERDPSLGYVFTNPDTGLEHSYDHPVKSGEVPDAERVQPANANEECFARAAREDAGEIRRLADELNRLRAELDKAVKALRPLARAAETFGITVPSPEALYLWRKQSSNQDLDGRGISLADAQRAQAIVAKLEQEAKGDG